MGVWVYGITWSESTGYKEQEPRKQGKSIQRNVLAVEHFRNMDRRATTEDCNTALETVHQNSITQVSIYENLLLLLPPPDLCSLKLLLLSRCPLTPRLPSRYPLKP
ncbi:hypothetical protein MG293_007208 [Ovis ammon polii]|uniref:Uncharacterized protein n=1 Tax=Ovis ammon polii TaxID=230172 RepID=A0AAD4UEE7_OVIAM|nr:hypothetical protein MG293_007208 [Ovis ammon polii]